MLGVGIARWVSRACRERISGSRSCEMLVLSSVPLREEEDEEDREGGKR